MRKGVQAATSRLNRTPLAPGLHLLPVLARRMQAQPRP